jgi:HPt (histidine-containing phosphotransfer) domain-containing protein
MPQDPKVPQRRGEASQCGGLTPAVPARLRRLFLDTMRSDLATLEQSLAQRDAQAAQLILHRIRGALAMVKLTEILTSVDAFDTQVRRDGWNEHAFRTASGLMLELRAFLAQV